ncbi:60S ribosome subunit biogenesis protein NIP7 homolog isoform X2 [Chanos chanos]|uniref:60S ribosome subunit biogenesis protein NIP7 homolog isoform X2 n=1 Tax=Chanos chanos TaxID=29144 RepID=A0A6J2UU38_CHACN|nr:60S ribosome subunit biogenesis protein NIP7 homolog isoform X2 [Chanos chanos]
MRPLTDEETKTMFEKLSKYIGENVKLLVDRPDGTYCFRLHSDRVYYISEKLLKLATNISREKLVSVGTCFGKFTKTQKFRLHITALDFLAPYAKGFGVAAKSTQECRKVDPMSIVVFHQADIGEYIRNEDTLT